MASIHQLEIWDYVTLVGIVIASSVIGLYHMFTARKIKNTKQFLVSSNKIGGLPIVISTVATASSAVHMLSFPLEYYVNGLSFVLFPLGQLTSIPFAMYLYLPVYYKLNRNTIFEYFELRYCKSIRMCTSIIMAAHLLMYTACTIYAPALVLNQVTGLDIWTSIISIGIVCTLYTSMGGFKAVIWSDVTQYLIMLGVQLLIIVKGTVDAGGPKVVWDRLDQGNRTQLFIWGYDSNKQYSSWTLLIGGFTNSIIFATAHQSTVQRILSTDSLKKSQRILYGSNIGKSIGLYLYALLGIIMYAYYYNCDPLMSERIKVRDQSMALFAMDILSSYKGLAGVFIAGLMCATLSTLSSYVNTLAAITVSDYVKVIKPEISEKAQRRIATISVIIYGSLCMALAALTQNMGGLLRTILGVNGMIGGSIFASLTVGMLIPWVNAKGAIVAFFGCMSIPMWAWIGNILNKPPLPHAPYRVDGCFNYTGVHPDFQPVQYTGKFDEFYSLASIWYGGWILVICPIIAVVVSILTGVQDPNKVDPDHFFPFVSKYLRNRQSKFNAGDNEILGTENLLVKLNEMKKLENQQANCDGDSHCNQNLIENR